MSRSLSAANTTEIDATHLHRVILVKLDFDTPVYVHSGIGTITYDSNDYTGVGHFGGISEARESELLGPTPITLSLNGIDSTLISEALDSGNYRDQITVYVGYRQDDGTLVDDPWISWRGWFEYAAIQVGDEGTVSITAQHDLALLDESSGARFNDEEQDDRYTADNFFTFITDQATIKLNWGGGPVRRNNPGPERDPTGPDRHLR